jgi:hypothetical protein
MDFPEKEIYAAISAELNDKSAYLTDKGHDAIAHIDFDRKQYEAPNEAGEFPFLRPAVFVEFGKIAYEHEGSKKRGTVPIKITVVQDKYVDSADASASQADFLKLLELKYLVNDILEGMEAECMRKLFLVEIEPDHDNRNLHVETILYTCQVVLKRNLIA